MSDQAATPEEARAKTNQIMGASVFSLKGRDGKLHEYHVRPHPTSEGSAWALRFSLAAGTPLMELLSSNLFTIYKSIRDDGLADLNLDRLIKELDLSGGESINALYGVVERVGEHRLHELFRYTIRDGKSLDIRTDQGRVAFDEAYRTNYAEYFKAIAKIERVNGFTDFLASILDVLPAAPKTLPSGD
jgi:hypothetical protein